MTNPISINATESAFAQETAEVWLVFLTVTHDELENPVRLVANEVDIERTVVGNEDLTGPYTAFPFEIVLPGENDEVPRAQIRVANADRTIVDTLRQLINQGAPRVALDVALASDPGDIQYGPMELRLVDAQYDAFFVTADLGVEDSLARGYPEARFDNPRFPGLYPG